MCGLVLDMLVLWFLLNFFSDTNWDDEKFKVFAIAFAIALLGSGAVVLVVMLVATTLGVWPTLCLGLAAYYVVGWFLLWILADLEKAKAAAAMGIFLGYKIIMSLVFAG